MKQLPETESFRISKILKKEVGEHIASHFLCTGEKITIRDFIESLIENELAKRKDRAMANDSK